jgi:cobalt-zinc-cadmium efflux system outer membrane protein
VLAERPLVEVLILAAVLGVASSSRGTTEPQPETTTVPGMAPMSGMPAMPGMAGGASQPPTPGNGAAPGRAPAAPAPCLITLAELEATALRNNPTLIQAQAQIDASLAKSLQAGLFPNPLLGYTSDQIGAAGTAGEGQGAFFEQEIYRGNKLRLSRAKYRQEAFEADLQAAAQQLRIVNGVRARYYDVLAAHRQLNVERELLKNHEEMLRTIRELMNTGQANRPELLQIQVGLQRQKIGVVAAENAYRQSWEFLTTLLGGPATVKGALVDTLEQDTPPIGFDAALETIYNFSPQLQAARAEVIRDEITVERERAQPRPNVFLRLVTGYNFETSNQTAAVQVGINPPLWNRNQGTIREAMAEVTRARGEVARLELMLRRRLAEVFTDYQTALTAVGIYRSETLPQSREAYDLLRAGYRNRRVPWADVLIAQRTYSDVVEEYLEALRTLRHSEVEIRGMLLTGGLDEPPPPTGLGGHIDATPQPR